MTFKMKSFPRLASIAVIILGLLVLAGWALDIRTLKTVFPGLVSMKVNTAIAFIFGGLSLRLQTSSERTSGRHMLLARAAAAVMLSLGLLTCMEYLMKSQFGIDQIFFQDTSIESQPSFPGRMSPASAVNFLLLGVALIWLDASVGPRPLWPAQYCTFASAVITMLAFVGYFYGVETLYRIAPYATIGLHTVIGFWLLCLGILLARPTRGVMLLFTSDRLGSVVVRRMLPEATAIVLLTGWLRVLGQRAGYFGLGFGTALYVTVLILILALLAAWIAQELNRIDDARQHEAEALVESERREHSRRVELEALMEVVPAVVWIAHDPECKRITGNRAGQEMLQVEPGANLSRTAPEGERPQNFRVYSNGKVLPDSELAMQVAGREGRPVLGQEWELRFSDGSSRWIYGNVVPLLNADGKVRGVVAAFVDITTLKQAQEEVRLSRENLRGLAARLQQVGEKERTRLAREIHDVLAQELTRLKVDTMWLTRHLNQVFPEDNSSPVQDRLAGMAGVIDKAIESVQKIATELRPVVLDSLGLCAAVEWQANEFETRTGIKCEVNLPSDELVIEREQSTALFRILQESLTNVVRHAAATRVEIDLHSDETETTLTVRDNGHGICPAELNNPHSLGLLGMRERATLLGGECHINGQPGHGTEVEARLPWAHVKTGGAAR